VMPNVPGDIDCTHVALRDPVKNPRRFMNRKDFHSINVQLVCDHQLNIINVCARHPGSVHDTFILRSSNIPEAFEEEPRVQGWVMGYPLQTWLMAPVWRHETEAETWYNEAHVATHSIVGAVHRAPQNVII